jgi:hypothetical protein
MGRRVGGIPGVMTIVTDSIASQVAELERLVPTPAEPLGYGRDLSCVDDITGNLDEVDVFSVTAIGEATIRRLSTARGMLVDDPDFGLDLRSYCNRGVPAHELAEIEGAVRSEVTKDDRIDSAAVTASYTAANSTLLVQIRIVPVDPRLGAFTLTLAASSAEVLLEALG